MNAKPRYARPAGLNDDLRQFTLGDLIDRLATIPLLHDPWGDRPAEPKVVRFDFASMAPTDLRSYRGFYHELAVGFTDEYSARPTLEAFLTRLKKAVGGTFYGWKGGDYRMTEDTPIWVAEHGNTSETAIVGVRDKGYEVVLDTAWCES